MQFPATLSTTQLPLFESIVAPVLGSFLPERKRPTLDEAQWFSELSLKGTAGNCLHLLAPMLRELSQLDNQRWLTLIAPPAKVTQQWLRDTGMDRERILLLQPRNQQQALELSCEALRLGRSHTVISWLTLDRQGKNRLAQAAHDGNSQSLNVRLD